METAFSPGTKWWTRCCVDRRQLPRRGQLGNGVQDCGLDGFQGSLPQARNPKLLEPIMRVEVVVPEDYMGPVIADLNSRRGQMQGTRIARRHRDHQRAKCRWRKCSVTPPIFAAARRGAAALRCIFRITSRRRETSRKKLLARTPRREERSRRAGNLALRTVGLEEQRERWRRRNSSGISRT
jgi:hypothetical protein